MQTASHKPIEPWFRTVAELPEDFSWKWLFGNDNPVEIDIGCGRGLFVVTASEANPDVNYLGLEIDYREGRRAAMRLKRREIANARIIGGDCRELLRKMVRPASVHAVHVLFPDPWWKKRHHKRRLFTDEFANLLAMIVEPGGFIHHWTDVEEYFRRVEALMNNHREFTTLPPPEVHEPEHDMDYHTSFERKKRKAGLPIYRGVWQRK